MFARDDNHYIAFTGFRTGRKFEIVGGRGRVLGEGDDKFKKENCCREDGE